MSPWQILVHVLNFIWPAAALASGLGLVLRWRFERSWWRQSLVLLLLGIAALVGGFWVLQRDGAMATYALMLLLQATWAWWVALKSN